jgi:eukaryotic-like serine/threonine-protein kinase
MNNKAPAAASLQGMKLPSGWEVVKSIDRGPNATGGNFSNAYLVSKDGQQGFMKAFDFSGAFSAANVLEALQRLTNAYIYERDLILHCNGKRLNKVVVALDHGEAQVPNYDQMNGRVYYLVFQLADGDVRGQVRANNRFDALWSARALRDVTVGMFQVHRQMIAHQDLKPSNVLLFGPEFRLADFGRASRFFTTISPSLAIAPTLPLSSSMASAIRNLPCAGSAVISTCWAILQHSCSPASMLRRR